MINIGVWGGGARPEDFAGNIRMFDPTKHHEDPDSIREVSMWCYWYHKSKDFGINYTPLCEVSDISTLDAIFVMQANDYSYSKLVETMNLPDIKKYLYLIENNSISDPNYNINMHSDFDYVFTWDEQLYDIDPEKYIKFNIALPIKPITDITQYKNLKDTLCSIICCGHWSDYRGELYTKRIDVIKWFEQYHPQDLLFYGRRWPRIFSSIYRGDIENKDDIHSRSYFTFCYENNSEFNNWITEKIFDAFTSGSVPIYWGAPNISDFIPENCYIDRRNYDSNETLYKDLINIKNTCYDEYIDNINDYIHSDSIKQFSYDNLFNTFNNQFKKDIKKV